MIQEFVANLWVRFYKFTEIKRDGNLNLFILYSLPLQFLRISVHDQKSKNKLLNSTVDSISGTRFIKKINM